MAGDAVSVQISDPVAMLAVVGFIALRLVALGWNPKQVVEFIRAVLGKG
jgi:hypothetical protein